MPRFAWNSVWDMRIIGFWLPFFMKNYPYFTTLLGWLGTSWINAIIGLELQWRKVFPVVTLK